MFTKARNAVWVQPVEMAREDQATQRIHLTPRQREVLALLCQGLPNKLICRRLNISAGTAKAHMSVILRELGVASRLQAVVQAQRLGLAGNDSEAAEPEPYAPTQRHAPLRLYEANGSVSEGAGGWLTLRSSASRL